MSEEQLPQENSNENQSSGSSQPSPQQPQPTNNGGFPPSNGGGFPPNNGGFGFGMQQSLPNATAVLVLGILSIVTCCCYGIIGLILAIIALVLFKKDNLLYLANNTLYSESSLKNLRAGKVCAIIGLVLNILTLIYYVVIIILFGAGMLSDPGAMQDVLKGLQ